jgi:hypothetical protein
MMYMYNYLWGTRSDIAKVEEPTKWTKIEDLSCGPTNHMYYVGTWYYAEEAFLVAE